MKLRTLANKILFNKNLSKSLRGAHITTPVDKYMKTALLMTAFSCAMMIVLCVLYNALHLKIAILSLIPSWITITVLCVVVPIGVFLCLYFYPALEASGRKNKINLDLPYAVTYMQALSSTITLYGVIRSVYEAEDLYREVSKEFGLIVRDVEVFGEDLLTAIENTIESTPSENFRELLNDLALIYRSGGNVSEFFNAKSESYREIARQELDSLLQFLEMIAEVYVTAFVAGPIAIIIMLVAQNLSGQNSLGNLMPLLYIFLPLGAIILIFILYILLPPDNLDITHKEIRDTEYEADVLQPGVNAEPDPKFLKQVEARKKVVKFLNILKHPIKFFISTYYVSITIGIILALIVLLTYFTKFFGSIFPSYTLQILVCALIIAFCFPVMAAYEIRKRYVSRIEKQLPDFLREISDMRDIGMTLQGAIFMISESKTGVLSSEIQIVSNELSYGSQLSGALTRMEERIGLVSVKRAISLLVKASEITDYIREILAIAIADLEHFIKMKSKRSSVSFVYLAVIYLSFGIYLFSAYEMNVAFIASFTNFNISFDIESSKIQMFNIGMILAFFSGIMAGQMSANNILCGLKHTIVMLIATVVTFVYVI